MAAIIVLANVGVIAIAVTLLFVIVVIGIHRGDRRHLSKAPQSASDAIARRLLVGVRYPDNEEGEDQ